MLRLGREASPWRFVPLALAALEQVPADADVRFLLACAYGKLGLRTAALEELERLPHAARGVEAVVQLATHLGRLPDDQVPAARLVETADRNAAVLERRGLLPGGWRAGLERWQATTAGVRTLRTSGGVLVQRDARGAWRRWIDEAAHAAAQGDKLPAQRPLLVDGLHMPLLLRRIIEITPTTSLGFETSVTLLCASIEELCDGLGWGDVTRELSLDRVRVVVDSDAPRRIEQELERVPEADPPLTLVMSSNPFARDRWSAGRVHEVAEHLSASNMRAAARACDGIEAHYTGMTPARWRERYAAALDGSGPPLRVLVVTTRYSTYVRHAAEDLTAGLRAVGCEATTFMEPDTRTQMITTAYPMAIDRHKPDLLVVVNALRAHLGSVVPRELPMVTWVQDALPQLFQQSNARAMQPLDFVAGYAFEELFTRFGFPVERFGFAPLAASAQKFHDGPVDEDLARRMACEVAYVSHQSETYDAREARLLRESASNPLLREAVPAVCEQLRAWVRAQDRLGNAEEPWALVRRRAVDAVRLLLPAGEQGDATASQLSHAVAAPLVEAHLRQQTLAWAADVCKRRGWRMHLYGRGWEKHPTLAAHARGELAHGEELRAAYQCARAHLHAATGDWLHQRVCECVLSGGLMLTRRKADDLATLAARVGVRAHEARARGVSEPWEELMLRWVTSACGAPREPITDPALCGAGVVGELMRACSLPDEVLWLSGDWSQSTFATPSELEALLAYAVERPAWRASVAGGMRDRTRAGLTFDAMALRMVGMVARSLGVATPGVARASRGAGKA